MLGTTGEHMILLYTLAALAAEPQNLEWRLSVDGQSVGTRTAKVEWVGEGRDAERVITVITRLKTKIGSYKIGFDQKITAYAANEPASFHSVMRMNGSSSEVQARWSANGWRGTVVESGERRSIRANTRQIDMSVADLLDPRSRRPLRNYSTARILSAETGEVWQGSVEQLGAKRLTIDGKKIDVQGVRWTSAEGPSEFWYSDAGYLVQATRPVAGVITTSTLTDPPPKGPDEFPVSLAYGGSIEEEDL